MIIKELTPLPTSKVRFEPSAFKLVPKEAGCYVLTTFTNDILYVGLAKNLYSRFIQHLNTAEKVSPTLEGKAIWFYYLAYDSTNLERLERTWINQFSAKHSDRPILNKIESPII